MLSAVSVGTVGCLNEVERAGQVNSPEVGKGRLWLILTAKPIITLVTGSTTEWERYPPSTTVIKKEFDTWRAGKELTFRLVNE